MEVAQNVLESLEGTGGMSHTVKSGMMFETFSGDKCITLNE